MHTPTLLTYNLAEAAEATGLSVRTLRHLIATRQIPFVRIGRSIRFQADVLKAWLESNTEPARTEATR